MSDDWADEAACKGVDPDLFFPERGASTREAKEICFTCDVQAECLAFAINNGEKFGIWGGLSERERRRIRRQVNIAIRASNGTVVEHGTRTRYVGGCRCDDCRGANDDYVRHLRVVS